MRYSGYPVSSHSSEFPTEHNFRHRRAKQGGAAPIHSCTNPRGGLHTGNGTLLHPTLHVSPVSGVTIFYELQQARRIGTTQPFQGSNQRSWTCSCLTAPLLL